MAPFDDIVSHIYEKVQCCGNCARGSVNGNQRATVLKFASMLGPLGAGTRYICMLLDIPYFH